MIRFFSMRTKLGTNWNKNKRSLTQESRHMYVYMYYTQFVVESEGTLHMHTDECSFNIDIHVILLKHKHQ